MAVACLRLRQAGGSTLRGWYVSSKALARLRVWLAFIQTDTFWIKQWVRGRTKPLHRCCVQCMLQLNDGC